MAGKILIAEDDQFILKAMTTKLSKEGYEVKIAVDGVQLMDILKSYIPDLIILDLLMPKKDGFEVLKEVKGVQRLKNIPILIASNLGQENDIQQVLALGATDYLIKSEFTLESLVQKIKNILK